MKKIAILVAVWVATFVGGHALGAGTRPANYDDYYFCAARNDTCQGSSWVEWDEFTGWCCCDENGDDQWFTCSATIRVYTNPPAYNRYCYRLVGSFTESSTTCVPTPIADEPIQEVINEGCGCTIVEQRELKRASGASPGSGRAR